MIYNLTPEQIQCEITGQQDQELYLTEIESEQRQMLNDINAFNYRQKQILNEKFPGIFNLRIIHPTQYDKTLYLTRLEKKFNPI